MANNQKAEDKVSRMFAGKELSALQKRLVEKLKEISEDTEFIYSVVTDVENDDDAQYLLEYIDSGEDVSYPQIILRAMYLNMVRNGEIEPF